VFWGVVTHLGLELGGVLTINCLRGRCQHRHHRYILDGIGLLALSVITVHFLG